MQNPSAVVEQSAIRSQQEIKTLIQNAELVRRYNPKSVIFLDQFFKQAKKHII